MPKLILFIALLFALPVEAKIHTEAITYKDGKRTLEGFLAYDDQIVKARPGVLVVHEWMGLDDFVKKRTEQLAELGYVGFAVDMYGKGIRPKTKQEASQLATYYKDNRNMMRSRIRAAFDTLNKNSHVDPGKLAVMGYCFGGTVALELARSGAPLEGTVSFHGELSTPEPKDAKNIKGKVLILHGGSDPFVGPAEVNGFVDEMNAANVNWTMVSYGPALHAFSNPESGNDKKSGSAYNAEADHAAWDTMKRFFTEIFGEAHRSI